MKNLYLLPTDKPSRLIKSQDNDFVYLNTNAPNWFENNLKTIKQNLYITSDGEIKEGYYFDLDVNKVLKYPIGCYNKGNKKIILTTDQDLIKDGVQAIDDKFLEWFVNNQSCESVEVKCYSKFNDGDFTDYKIIIPKEEPTLANIKCTCMSFEPNCFTGSCRKCGFLPKEEAKQVGQITEKGIIDIIGNCANCGIEFHIHKDIEEPKQETLEEVAYKLFSTMPSEISTSTAKSKALELAKWQQEQDKNKFSEEEVKELLYKLMNYNPLNKELDNWFEKNKKK